jgi:hypothetical protein
LPTTANNPVIFATTGELPTNFDLGTTYYILTGATSTAIEVSDTIGGVAISAGSSGSGTQTLITPFTGFSTTANSTDINVRDFALIPSSFYQASINDYVFYETPVILGNLWLTGPYKIVNASSSPNPNYTISVGLLTRISSISRTSNVVTLTTIGIHNFQIGQNIFVSSVDDSSFNGIFTISSVTGTTIVYNQTAADATSFNGNVVIDIQFGGVVPLFTGTAGLTTISVNAPNHPYSVGSTFNIQTPTVVGGIILSGNYTVNSVTSSSFTISAASAVINSGNSYMNSGAYYSTVSGSSIVTVVDPTQTYNVGDIYTVIPQVIVGGLLLNFSAPIISVSGYTFTFDAGSAASSTDYSFSYPNGRVRSQYYVGQYIQGTSVAYNEGTYNVGIYNSGVTPQADPGTSIPASDWTLDNWGQILIANPKNGAIYYYNPVGGTLLNASYIPNSPLYNTGMFVAMPQRQIIAYGSSFDNVQDPLLIRWCDIEDFTIWTASSVNQAGSYRIPTGSRIVGGGQASQQGLFWTNLDLWSMQYIGPPLVYGFNKISSNCGLIGQKAVGQLSNAVYWMSQKQFFKYDGNGVTPIVCPIWDVVFNNLYPGAHLDNSNYVEKIRCATNTQYNEVTWYYPAARVPILDENGLPTNDFTNGNGEVNAYVKYNVLLNTWDYGFQDPNSTDVVIGRTAWIDQSIAGNPMGAGTFTSGENTYNYVYQHETSNNADGAAMKPFFITGYFAIAEGENKAFIDQVWPDMIWGDYGEVNSANVKITFNITDYPEVDPTSYGPYSMYLGQTPPYLSVRMRGKLAAITLSSEDLDSFWRLGNIRYRVSGDGKY